MTQMHSIKNVPKRAVDFFFKVCGLILSFATLVGFHATASAQQYPTQPIKIINTFPAGGSGDNVLRIVFEKVGQALGQPFVIDTRAGAAGAIGNAYVAKAAPDGYTFVLGTASTFGTNSSTQKNLPYDPIADFTPVINIATTPFFLLVNPNVPATNLKDFLRHANANPGKLNFGSFGLGSSNHLAYELFKQNTNVDIVHVPYKGGAPLITALLGGEIQSSLDVYATSNQHVRSGKFRVLGVASAKRFSLTPDVPTLTEQGFAVEGGTFFALLGPAKLPQHIVTTLNREINKVLQMPEVRERLAAIGVEQVGGTPEVLATTIRDEVQKWSRLVQSRNLTFD
jgi:tripartite-type tricarboxylate transporter receptor subunit TctC